MKKYWMIVLLGLISISFGQQLENNDLACDCPSCREKAASGKEFSLPGLEGLEDEELKPVDPVERTAHDDHEHTAEVVPLTGGPVGDKVADLDSHEGHDHEDHAGSAHGENEGIALTQARFDKLGIQIYKAKGRTISKVSVFPAEIKLNRDRTASVSARYASIVRQVFAEIGDTVRKGDVLASLENRETMAVYSLLSPRDGIILSKNLAVGEIATDDEVLFEVADLSTVWADISVFPQYQHLLQKGMLVKFIAHDGHSAEGRVKYISPIVSHETRTFTARCILEGADEDFTPGAFVRARINVETADVSVSVPREAVQTIQGESVVFVPSSSGFIMAPVKTGLADEYNIEVVSGLEPGDKYVAVGAFALKAQMVTSGIGPHAGHGH